MSAFGIFFIIFVAVCALLGLNRGIIRQSVRIVTTVIAFAIAFTVANSYNGEIIAAFDSIGSMQELVYALKSEPEFAELITPKIESILVSLDTSIIGYSFSVFGGIISTLAFTTIFVLANIVLKLAYAIVSLILKLAGRPSPTSKIIGAVMAAAEGAVVAALILLPVANIAGIVGDTYALIEQSECEGKDEIMAEYEVTTAAFTEDGILSMIESVGGRAMLDKFSTFEIDGETRNHREDLVLIFKILILDLSEISETDWKSLDTGDKAAIESIIDTIDKSKYLNKVGVTLFHAMHAAAESGTQLIEVEAPLDKLMNAVLAVLGQTSEETFDEDLNTLKEIYFILSDAGVLVDMANGENLTDAFIARDKDGETAINKILEVIERNPRTKPLINEIAKISVSLLSSKVEIDGDIEEMYENLREDMGSVLAVDPSDKEALSNELGTVLYDNGINLDKGVIDNMADYISENHSEVSSLTEEDLDYLILNYYDAYLEYIEGAEAN